MWHVDYSFGEIEFCPGRPTSWVRWFTCFPDGFLKTPGLLFLSHDTHPSHLLCPHLPLPPISGTWSLVSILGSLSNSLNPSWRTSALKCLSSKYAYKAGPYIASEYKTVHEELTKSMTHDSQAFCRLPHQQQTTQGTSGGPVWLCSRADGRNFRLHGLIHFTLFVLLETVSSSSKWVTEITPQ